MLSHGNPPVLLFNHKSKITNQKLCQVLILRASKNHHSRYEQDGSDYGKYGPGGDAIHGKVDGRLLRMDAIRLCRVEHQATCVETKTDTLHRSRHASQDRLKEE